MSAGDKVSMKEKQEKQRGLSVEQSAMAGVTPAVYFPSPGQPQFQTPSPFEYSIASTTWSSRHSFQVPTLVLRSLALLFSFVSALSLAAPRHGTPLNNPPLRYCFVVTIGASVYSAFQLFKGVCDFVYRGILISEVVSDYMSFIFDQLVCYLLISSASVILSATQHIKSSTPLWKASVVSFSMSFAAFLVFAACGILSGYKLSKRISW